MSCNRQQLNITCGTDVVLHDRLIFDGETFDPNLSVGIAANLVSSLGKRTALDVQVVDDELLISVPWVDGTLPGCYGLEVTGSCNSKKWATYADSLIKYTKATRIGASEVTVESDSYDITQEIGYRYGEGGNVDDVKVNGVSVVSGGRANITIPGNVGAFVNDKKYQTEQQVAKAIQDNIVPNAVVTVDNNTGTPYANVTKTGNTLNFDFHNLKGGKGDTGQTGATGPQGATGVYDSQTQDFLVTLETTTGDSQTKTMTQKAITDSVAGNLGYKEMGDDYFAYGQGMAVEVWSYNPSYTRTHKVIKINGEKYLKITANSTDHASIAFLTSYTAPTAHAQSIPYCDGFSYPVSIDAGSTKILEVPSDCQYIVINCINESLSSNLDHTPSYVGVSVSAQDVYEGKGYDKATNVCEITTSPTAAGAYWNECEPIPVKSGRIRITLTGPVGKKSILRDDQSYVYIFAGSQDNPVSIYMAFTFGGEWENYVEYTDNIATLDKRVIETYVESDTTIILWHRIATGQSLTMRVEQLDCDDLPEVVERNAKDSTLQPMLVNKTTMSETSSIEWHTTNPIVLEQGVYKVVLNSDSVPLHRYNGTVWARLGLCEEGETPVDSDDIPYIEQWSLGDTIDTWESDYFEVTSLTRNQLKMSYRIVSGSIVMQVFKCEGSDQTLLRRVDDNAKAIETIDNGEIAIMPIRYQSEYCSRHFVPLTDGFSVENGYNGFCYIKNSSPEYAEGTIGVLGEPTENFYQRFNFYIPSPLGQDADENTQIKVIVVTESGEHVITNNNGNSFKRSWYVDGVSTNMPYANPIDIKAVNGVGQVNVVGSDIVTVLEGLTITSVYLKITTNNETDIIIRKYITEGYSTRLHTHPQRYHTVHPLAVCGDMLYVAYYAPNGYLTVYSRNFLTGETATSQKSVLRRGDMHEWIAMEIDNDECMHIMCNCHSNNLYYLYGGVSDIDDIEVSDKLAWNNATYPSFLKHGDDLFAIFRDGASAGGRWKVYKYSYVNKTYSTTTEEWICDGTRNGSYTLDDTTACPYWETDWRYDEASGWYYSAFCWRNTFDVVSNHDICFIKTRDFVTFYNYIDEELPLPITLENKYLCQLKCVKTGSHLLNQQGIRTIFVNGQPVIVWFMDDENGNTNLFMMHFTGEKKVIRKITHFTGQFYASIFVSYDNMPGFVTISFVNYIYAYDKSRSIFIAPDLTVYDSELIAKDLTDENGKISLIQANSKKVWAVFKGSTYRDNYDSVHNYGVQIIE